MMSSALPILIPLVVLATLVVLGLGIFSMVKGGRFNARNSNRLMRLRVLVQFVAVLLIAVAFLTSSD